MPERYDLVVIGGGIQGAFLTLEASRRGLRVLLVEKGRVGEGTSDQSLRVVHGGFRYLQSLDLGRFRTSRREQRWFLENLPDLVRPLPCLLPLDGRGLRRPAVARIAALLDVALGDSPTPPPRAVPRGELQATLGFSVPRAIGGLSWHDAVLADGAATVRALTEWAGTLGAHIAEHSEITELLVKDGVVCGVRGSVDAEAGVVIVAAGAANAEIATELGGLGSGALPFPRWVVGYNAIIDRPAPFDGGFGFRPPQAGASAYFALPRGEQLAVGTLYASLSDVGDEVPPTPSVDSVSRLLVELNRAVPGVPVRFDDVVGYDVGVLPAANDPSVPTDRPHVLHAQSGGGPRNLWFVCPEKLTTARAVAENLLQRVFVSLDDPLQGTERPSLRRTSAG